MARLFVQARGVNVNLKVKALMPSLSRHQETGKLGEAEEILGLKELRHRGAIAVLAVKGEKDGRVVPPNQGQD